MMMDLIDKEGGVPNFVGAAIGNGCWGNAVGTCSFSSPKAREIKFEFFKGHGMLSQPVAKRVEEACGDFSAPLGLDCGAALLAVGSQTGTCALRLLCCPTACANEGVMASFVTYEREAPPTSTRRNLETALLLLSRTRARRGCRHV